MIWKEPIRLEALNTMPANIATLIGIEFTGWDAGSLTARHAGRCPYTPADGHPARRGICGARRIVGSIASNLIIDTAKHMPVGLEINANHLRPVASGFVTGTCTPIHIGSRTHVWDIRIVNEKGKLVCISRLTVAIVARTGR